MIIKKFTAKTEEEAIAQARTELGENIVIMNVKATTQKGFFGFAKKGQTEVTVAKEEESERYPGVGAQKKMPEEASLRETFRQVAKAAGTERVQEAPVMRSVPEENQNLLVEKLDSLQSMIERRLQTEEDVLPESEPEETEEEDSEMVRFMKLLYNTMVDNEVDEKYANQIIDEIEKNVKPNLPFDHALADVYQKMILKFGKAVPIEKNGKGLRVIFFAGPTGVGKTTTIAKIASSFRLEQKQKVALFTADTYRIAAAEQLRTYANILDTPLDIVYSSEELNEELHKSEEYDLVLVDTAGFSHKNEEQRNETKELIDQIPGEYQKEVYLVLSATTKYRDLLDIADIYRKNFQFKLIFTKLDETSCFGNILNMKLYTGADLSYSTYGQNVPEDIEIFDTQKIVKLLLGGK